MEIIGRRGSSWRSTRARRACTPPFGASPTSSLPMPSSSSYKSSPLPLPSTPSLTPPAICSPETPLQRSRSSVRSVMERAEAVCNDFNHKVSVERFVGTGDAREVICKAVDKLRADTLVMGCHCYGFMKRALLGSVREYCSKHVKCPVVIVKNQ